MICIIDQSRLPYALVIEELRSSDNVISAIRDMKVRGAPLIGVTAAFGMYLACLEQPGSGHYLSGVCEKIKATRPTAVNLFRALDIQMKHLFSQKDPDERIQNTFNAAKTLLEEEIAACRNIGEHGLAIIEAIANKKQGVPVNILTHCNAGWLATIKYGTATAPIYMAHEKGMPVHVWVDETRPRNQGSRLTAWELSQAGVPHTIVTDNAGGHLMQEGMVDMVITGSDRTARNGDSANKIGTYLKALAAKDNNIPFYIAIPSTSIDWDLRQGLRKIPVEERSPDEVHFIEGKTREGAIRSVRITPENSRASNFGFDVTPGRLITGLITERGVCKPEEKSLLKLFPEKT